MWKSDDCWKMESNGELVGGAEDFRETAGGGECKECL